MAETPAELRVRLLGGLTVEGVDEAAFGSRKVRLLLKRLAIDRGRSVSSEALIDTLWPTDPPASPVDQLGVLVSRLRRVLGAGRVPHRNSGYALEADWLDVDELARRVDEAVAAHVAGRLGSARSAAEAAIATGRDGLLPDDDGPWLEIERARCNSLLARAHHVLAEAALLAGDPDTASAAAETSLRGDPYDETALRLLMRAHAAAGRPASGLAAYVRVRTRLAEDLGVDPTPETERIHDQLVVGEGDLADPRPSTSSPAPIAGRQAELVRLDRCFERAAAGGALAVALRGEAGIGKSTLVSAWIRALGPAAVIVNCRCDALGRDLPLQPLLDGLARHLDALGPTSAEVVGAEAGTLGGLLDPTLLGTTATVARDPDVGRAQLFVSLLSVIERLGPHPVVLIVEDAHHAGTSTLEWLSFALRRGHRLMLVLTMRPEASALPGADEIELGPLDEAAMRAMLVDVGDRQLVDEVLARSGGNPLFLASLAAAPGAHMPATIRDVVDQQTDQLGPAATTIRTAAIVGGTIDLDLLAEIIGAPIGQVLDDLELGCRARLLQEAAGGIAFRHELVREAVEASVGSARRALVHRNVARALDRRLPRDALGIAVHARLGGDMALASAAFVDAGRAAFDRFDVGAALEHVGAALELGPTPAAIGLRARLRLAVLDLDGARLDAAEAVASGGGAEALEIAAWTAYYRRQYDEARRFADDGAAIATDVGLELSCRAVGGRVRHGAGDLAGADEKLAAAELAPVEVRGVADVWLACLRVHQGRPAEALELAGRALVQPDRLAHKWAAMHGRFARVMALGQLGRVDEALTACDELERARLRAGDVGTRFEGIAANGRGWLLRNVGCFELADDSNERALAAHAEQARLSASGLTEAYWVAKLDLIDGRLLVGDLDAAVRGLDEANGLDEWQGTMAWHQRQRLGLLRARAARMNDDVGGAWSLADAVRTDATERGSRRYQVLASALMASYEPNPDPARVEAVIAGLESCARLEGWRLASDLARLGGSDAHALAAERMAAGVITHAGDHRASVAAWVERRLRDPSTS